MSSVTGTIDEEIHEKNPTPSRIYISTINTDFLSLGHINKLYSGPKMIFGMHCKPKHLKDYNLGKKEATWKRGGGDESTETNQDNNWESIAMFFLHSTRFCAGCVEFWTQFLFHAGFLRGPRQWLSRSTSMYLGWIHLPRHVENLGQFWLPLTGQREPCTNGLVIISGYSISSNNVRKTWETTAQVPTT